MSKKCLQKKKKKAFQMAEWLERSRSTISKQQNQWEISHVFLSPFQSQQLVHESIIFLKTPFTNARSQLCISSIYIIL